MITRVYGYYITDDEEEGGEGEGEQAEGGLQ
jgi:hypothetical protein